MGSDKGFLEKRSPFCLFGVYFSAMSGALSARTAVQRCKLNCINKTLKKKAIMLKCGILLLNLHAINFKSTYVIICCR